MSLQTNHSGRAGLIGSQPGFAGVIMAVVLVLAGTAIIAISAQVKVPFYPVPMTLQTLAIMAIAAAYGSRLAVATVVAYLVEGAVGLPVFAGAGAGPAYLLGPTGGFLVGFVIAAGIVGTAADRGWDRSVAKLFGAMLVGEIVLMALGFAWLAWFATLSSGATGLGVRIAFTAGVVPFVLGDLLKLALAALAVPACWAFFGSRK